MANTVRIKRRAAGGASGAPSSLANAELAFNEQDLTLYYGLGTGGAGGSATSVISIAGTGAFVDKSSTQTISGAKTFSTIISGSIDGNAATATKWATARNLSLTGDITATLSSVDGSSAVSAAAVLATVNSNVGTFTKLTVNGKGLVTAASNAVLADLGTTTADFSMNSFKITNLADPVSAQDAATKNYVDSVAQGLDAKGSVKAATTASITLSGTQTIDGVSVVASDRVLVKNQGTASANGIYVVASGAWTRATDMDAWTEVPNAYTFVEQGTVNADTGWVCTSDQGGTLGTTAINWTQFSSAGSYLAGNGLTLTGTTFDVGGTTDRISVSADAIDIAPTYVGQTSITTLGTIATGTWSATTIAANKGGTGQTSYAVGDLLYADTTSTLAKLADVATGNALISGGVTTAPSWGKIGLTTHVSGTLGVGNGGTGTATTPTNGQLLIGNGTNYTLAALTQGTGITITNASGSITVTNASPMTYPGAGIPNSTGTAWGTSYTTSGSGTVVALATGAALTTPSLDGETFSVAATVTAGTNAQGQGALTKDYNIVTTTSANPSGVTLPTATTGRRIIIANRGTNPISIYPASGGTIDALAANAAITLNTGNVMEFYASSTTQWYSSYNLTVAGTGVSSISFGTTGFTPSTATSGAITVAGTLVVGNGGTGVTTLTGLVKGNGTSAFSAAVAGTDYLDPASTIDGGTF